MKVKILKAFGSFIKGQMIPEMPNNQARTLIGRGLVEEVVETKAMQAPVNRAIGAAPVNRQSKQNTLKLR